MTEDERQNLIETVAEAHGGLSSQARASATRYRGEVGAIGWLPPLLQIWRDTTFLPEG